MCVHLALSFCQSEGFLRNSAIYCHRFASFQLRLTSRTLSTDARPACVLLLGESIRSSPFELVHLGNQPEVRCRHYKRTLSHINSSTQRRMKIEQAKNSNGRRRSTKLVLTLERCLCAVYIGSRQDSIYRGWPCSVVRHDVVAGQRSSEKSSSIPVLQFENRARTVSATSTDQRTIRSSEIVPELRESQAVITSIQLLITVPPSGCRSSPMDQMKARTLRLFHATALAPRGTINRVSQTCLREKERYVSSPDASLLLFFFTALPAKSDLLLSLFSSFLC